MCSHKDGAALKPLTTEKASAPVRHQLSRLATRCKNSFTYERFDALQNQVAGDVAWQILAELSDQLGVALVLLP